MTLRKLILAWLLPPDQRALLEAMEAPDRWQPDVALTKEDAEAWEQTLHTPLLVKIDHAMINWSQQEAQRVLVAPAHDLARQAGFALGVRTGWQMAKSLSRMVAAEGDRSEPTAPTAAATLDHLAP